MRILSHYLVNAAAVVACGAMLAGCDKEEPPQDNATKRDGNELVLIVSPESPPFTHIGENGEICGIDMELVRDAAKRMGRPLKVITADFTSLLPAVKSGKADIAASGITITDSRMRSVDFTDKYMNDGGSFLYRRGTTPPTLVTAERLRVATVDSSTHDFYLTNHGLDPVRYSTCDDTIKALVLGKVDTVYLDHSILSLFADNSNGAFEVSPLVTKEFIGIAVRKGMPELKAVLNEVIKERHEKERDKK